MPIAETAAELFERRQKHFGRNLSQLTPARMAIAGEAFELLGDQDDVALLEVVRAGLAHENARAVSVPFGNLFDEFLPAKALRNSKYLKEAKRFDTAKWKNDLPCSYSVWSYNYHNFN